MVADTVHAVGAGGGSTRARSSVPSRSQSRDRGVPFHIHVHCTLGVGPSFTTESATFVPSSKTPGRPIAFDAQGISTAIAIYAPRCRRPNGRSVRRQVGGDA